MRSDSCGSEMSEPKKETESQSSQGDMQRVIEFLKLEAFIETRGIF